MNEQLQQLQDSLETVREKYKSINRKIDIIRTHIEENSMFKSKSITDIIKELVEFNRNQEICAENYKAIFNEELPDGETLSGIENRIDAYKKDIIKQETGNIAEKFKTLHSEIPDCQADIDKYAADLEKIDIGVISLEDYKSAVSDYIRLYDVIESGDTDEKIKFTDEETVFSDNSSFLLRLLQGKIVIKQSSV